MAKNNMPPSVPLQEFGFKQQRNVYDQMVKAKGIRAKLSAGSKTAISNKMSSMFGDHTTKTAGVLRLFGMDKTAKFWDMFALNEEKIRAIEEKKTRQTEERWRKEMLSKGANPKKIAQEISNARKKRYDDAKKEHNKYFGNDPVAKARVGKKVTGVTSTANVKVDRVVLGIAQDVKDIKALLMPKNFNIKLNKKSSEQGVQYNPLSPTGQQFKLTENGKPTTLSPGSRIMEKAETRAAMMGATLAYKIQKRDEKREKYKWKDKKEAYKQEDPLVTINKRLGRIEDQLEGKDDKKGWLYRIGFLLGGLWLKLKKFISPLLTIVRGIWTVFKPILKGVFSIVRAVWTVFKPIIKGMWSVIKALGRGVGRLLGKWFPGLSLPGLIAGGAAVATTGAMAYALDKGMKQSADTAIDKITSDVTRNQERAGFKAEDSYAAYKRAIDDSLANKTEEQKAYIKQQLTQSEGLSELEKKMAARYFQEKEGVVADKGVSTPKATESVPSELQDTDTYDTNYSTPPQTGVLSASTYESRLKNLADVIASGESKGDYNIYNKGTVGKNKGKTGREDLSKMTISEYLRRGSLGKDDPQKMFAVGKYQIIPKTMENIVKSLGLNPDTTTLTPEVQDRMFRHLIESKPAVRKYLEGQSSDQNAALLALAKEWASVGVPQDTYRNGQLIKAGESYYSGVGGNKAHTAPETVASALSPVQGVNGGMMDQQARSLQASNQGSKTVNVVTGPTVNQNTVNQTGPKRKVERADVLTNDNALARTVMRDSQHPVNVG